MIDRLSSFFSFFLSAPGLLLLSFIDSSVFFFTPLANDIVVIMLVARDRDQFWLYPLIATVGSIGGIALTYWIGHKLGEPGLERFISERALERAKHRVKQKGAFAVGALALVPPPFPLTPLVLVAGALEVSFARFLSTAGAVRALRFGIESFLAHRYGERITGWLESSVFEWIIGVLIALAVAGTGYGIAKAIRHRKGKEENQVAPADQTVAGM